MLGDGVELPGIERLGANFREHPKAELPRTPFPGYSVNRGGGAALYLLFVGADPCKDEANYAAWHH